MPSKSEAILSALFVVLDGVSGVEVKRNDPLPEDIGTGGLIVLRDGEPGEPDITLSPLRYDFEHLAEAEVYVQDADNDATFDSLKVAIGAAIAADRTLGGLCDWIEGEAPRTEDLGIPGATSIKAAIIPIRLFYWTSDPLA
jgi:hypothetical protein